MNERKIAAELRRAMAQERKALLSGSLEDLGPIVARKLHLVAAIRNGGAHVNTPILAALRRDAQRNSRLYASSLAGLKSVHDKVAQLANGSAELKTYGADGARAALASGAGRMHRRS